MNAIEYVRTRDFARKTYVVSFTRILYVSSQPDLRAPQAAQQVGVQRGGLRRGQ
jgi:hypothetical protein